jgi:hypothetical protein
MPHHNENIDGWVDTVSPLVEHVLNALVQLMPDDAVNWTTQKIHDWVVKVAIPLAEDEFTAPLTKPLIELGAYFLHPLEIQDRIRLREKHNEKS